MTTIIAIGTTNPAKINAVKKAFSHKQAIFIPVSVPSGVSDQPLSDEETIRGALHRAEASLNEGKSEIGIGLEGGVVETPYGLFLCNWGALADSNGNMFIAGGARIPLPHEIATEVRKGKELGIVMDEFTKKNNVRNQEGAIGILTNGYITRDVMYEHIVKMLAGQYVFHHKQSQGS
jgi:inosine/xanthosine triphosphatase